MIISLPKPIALKAKQSLIIYPLADIQSEEEYPRLIDLMGWSVEQEKAGNLIRAFGTGDYFETTSPTERVKLAGANLHDDTYETLNKAYIRQSDTLVSILAPLKNKIMGILEGHHKYDLRFERKIDGKLTPILKSSDNYIAEKLNADFSGDGLLLMDLLVNGYRFSILAMHGYGSARTPGARLNKRVNMVNVVRNCNWYCQAHDNMKDAHPEEPFVLTSQRGELKYLKQYFTGAGSWQRSYNLGRLSASYAEKLALPPSCLGTVMMTIRFDEKNKRLDYTCSV